MKKHRKKNRGQESFVVYMYRVLKQVYPNLGISRNAMRILDSLMDDIFSRLAAEASRLMKFSNRSTLTSRDIQTAVRLLMPSELGRHAMSEATKAVHRYAASK